MYITKLLNTIPLTLTMKQNMTRDNRYNEGYEGKVRKPWQVYIILSNNLLSVYQHNLLVNKMFPRGSFSPTERNDKTRSGGSCFVVNDDV